MDKLRALSYFVAAAETRSFSAAARRLEVSVPAVSKLVTALERQVGVALFERTSQGLTLTSDGENYLDACLPALQQLAMADSLIAGTAARARGTVMLAATAYVLQSCVMPALPRFHDRYPEIQLDLRAVTRLNDPDADGADVFLLIGWLDQSDLVQRLLVRNRFLLVASPAYWAEHGMPKQPSDLRDHTCLLMRNPGNTVLDLWRCTRDGVEEAVTVRGWLLTTYRDAILEAVLAGQGVARFSELTIRQHLQSGRLVPGLTDWDMLDAPPLHLLYRSGHRRSPRVRPVIDFLGELFRDLQEQRAPDAADPSSADRPYWYRHRHGRASAAARRP